MPIKVELIVLDFFIPKKKKDPREESHFATGKERMAAFCRITEMLSQQHQPKVCNLFGMNRKSSYICIRKPVAAATVGFNS
jgi:hypothetical protein